MMKKIFYLSIITILIMNCNSKSASDNLKLQNKEQVQLSKLKTIFVDTDSSSIKWIGKKIFLLEYVFRVNTQCNESLRRHFVIAISIY